MSGGTEWVNITKLQRSDGSTFRGGVGRTGVYDLPVKSIELKMARTPPHIKWNGSYGTYMLPQFPTVANELLYLIMGDDHLNVPNTSRTVWAWYMGHNNSLRAIDANTGALR